MSKPYLKHVEYHFSVVGNLFSVEVRSRGQLVVRPVLGERRAGFFARLVMPGSGTLLATASSCS